MKRIQTFGTILVILVTGSLFALVVGQMAEGERHRHFGSAMAPPPLWLAFQYICSLLVMAAILAATVGLCLRRPRQKFLYDRAAQSPGGRAARHKYALWAGRSAVRRGVKGAKRRRV